MRRALLLIFLPVLLAGDLATGQRLLLAGRYREATLEFREVTQQRPDHAGGWVGLARARAGLGDCARALEILPEWRERRAYNARAALAEGWCWFRIGQMGQAQEAAADAVRLKPNLGPGWYLLALSSQALGDEVGWAEAMDGLSMTPRSEVMAELAEGWRAVEEGDDEALMFAMARLRELSAEHPRAGVVAQIAMMDAQRWLDLGHPTAAEASLLSIRTKDDDQVRILLLRAEAARRQGLAEVAARYMRSSSVRARRNPLPRSVRLRTLVDMGLLEIPTQRLPELAASPHPEDLATGWYIARAIGDSDRTAWFAKAWALANTNPDRRLEHLIPASQDVP